LFPVTVRLSFKWGVDMKSRKREGSGRSELLQRFIWKLGYESGELLEKFHARLGGDYPSWDVNELGEEIQTRARDIEFIHPDRVEALKEKLVAGAVDLSRKRGKKSRKLLSEMYGPFLKLPLRNKKKLLNGTNEAFGLWEKEDLIPYLNQRITSHIEQEKKSLVTQDEGMTDEERFRAIEVATAKAHEMAASIASSKKGKREDIICSQIAEQVMNRCFRRLIPRTTGRVMKNHQKELTPEWKEKRDSIRIGVFNKFKKKKSRRPL
jgi:hypothetical protein